MANPRKTKRESFFEKMRLQQSYPSLILGIFVVVVVAVLVVFLVRRNTDILPIITPAEIPQAVSQDQPKQEVLPAKYTAVAGDTLWSVSEKFYKSGYNWVDIAAENKLENPNILTVGTELSIPNVKPKMSEVVQRSESHAITGGEYTVVEDDNLWAISVRAYGDGYKWGEIARANNLDNPNVIHPGNTLTLPR